MMMKQLIRKK